MGSWVLRLVLLSACLLSPHFDKLQADDTPAQRMVQSPDDYREHMTAHRLRVILLGLEVYREFPQEFSHISPTLIVDWLALHDQAKVNTDSDFLEMMHQTEAHERIGDRLYHEIYGQSISSLTGQDRERALDLVNELNSIDSLIGRAFLHQRGFIDAEGRLSEAGKELQRIEKLVDIIDREQDPVAAEELGRTPWPAEQAFSSPSDFAIIAHLRDRYEPLTQGLSYQDIHDSLNEEQNLPVLSGFRRTAFEETARRLCIGLLKNQISVAE